MPYVNRKCNNCGKEYYVCYSCEKVNSWKNVCCSRQCYRQYIKNTEKIEPQITKIGEVYNMFGYLKNGGKIKIIGYDLELNRYDGENKETYSLEDFTKIDISIEEFQKIIEK